MLAAMTHERKTVHDYKTLAESEKQRRFWVGFDSYIKGADLDTLHDDEERRGWRYARRCELASIDHESEVAYQDDLRAMMGGYW